MEKNAFVVNFGKIVSSSGETRGDGDDDRRRRTREKQKKKKEKKIET